MNIKIYTTGLMRKIVDINNFQEIIANPSLSKIKTKSGIISGTNFVEIIDEATGEVLYNKKTVSPSPFDVFQTTDGKLYIAWPPKTQFMEEEQ